MVCGVFVIWFVLHLLLIRFTQRTLCCNMEAEETTMRDREAQEAIDEKELEDITTLLEQLALICEESESGPAMDAHEFINYELEFDLNNSYLPNEEDIIGMLDEGDDVAENEHIEEVDNVQISDVVVDEVGFKNAKSALVTLNNFWNKDLLKLHLSFSSFEQLRKEIRSWCAQESHLTIIDPFFHYA